MVCIPCFAAPVLLFIWYKFIYPLVRPILERYFGDRFALPRDPDYCPICPMNSKGQCERPTRDKTSGDKNENRAAESEPLEQGSSETKKND